MSLLCRTAHNVLGICKEEDRLLLPACKESARIIIHEIKVQSTSNYFNVCQNLESATNNMQNMVRVASYNGYTTPYISG